MLQFVLRKHILFKNTDLFITTALFILFSLRSLLGKINFKYTKQKQVFFAVRINTLCALCSPSLYNLFYLINIPI